MLGPGGQIWRKAALDAFFKVLIRMIASESRARQLSIHSWRVWLACALLANGCTPEQIMQLLRWSSDAARKLYARMQELVVASLLDAAAEASFESIRAHSLLGMSTSVPTAEEARHQDAGRALEAAAARLDAAAGAGAVATAEQLAAACAIDDDDVHARVHNEMDALRSRAAREDARRDVDGGSDDEEDDGE